MKWHAQLALVPALAGLVAAWCSGKSDDCSANPLPLRRFNPLKVPKKLAASLPYASKPRTMKPQGKATYLQKRAVVLEPEEKRALAVMQQVRALRRDQVARRKEKQGERREAKKKKLEKEQRDGLQLSAATSGKSTKVKSEPKAKIQLSAVSTISPSLLKNIY